MLRDVLQTQNGIAPRNTDVLRSILDRLDALEKRASMPVTLQTQSEPPAPRPHTPSPPRPVAGGLIAIPDEHSEEAYLCQIAGMTIAVIGVGLATAQSSVGSTRVRASR